MCAEIRAVLKPLLKSKLYDISYLKLVVKCSVKYIHCLQEPKHDKNCLNGQTSYG